MGEGVPTMLPRGEFSPVSISASKPVMSFYVTFATREMLTTEIPEHAIHSSTSNIAIQNNDVGISFGLNKVRYVAAIWLLLFINVRKICALKLTLSYAFPSNVNINEIGICFSTD